MAKQTQKKPQTKSKPVKKPASKSGAKAPDVAEGEGDVQFGLTTSRQFESWLGEQNATLAFTTYQAGKLFFLGLAESGRLSVFNRTLERCMGMAYGDGALYVSTLYQIIKFVDAAKDHPVEGAFDALFVPQAAFFTGDVDAHDLAIGAGGQCYFANTLFSCVAQTSLSHSFKPVWQPPFIDRLSAEDRCHLNGLAIDAGAPRFVTSVADTNVADGWRDHRASGGIVIDISSNQTIASGLSMPHSPRIHRGKLWLHNSGTGHFGYIDPKSGSFEPVAFCPGYLRGLDFVNNFAVAGLSKPRDNKTFSGLALDDNLAKEKVEARCGLYIIDLDSGDIVHWVKIEGIISELYDVTVLPDRKNTAAVGFKSDEIRRVISIE